MAAAERNFNGRQRKLLNISATRGNTLEKRHNTLELFVTFWDHSLHRYFYLDDSGVACLSRCLD
jgi:hypothetical protein